MITATDVQCELYHRARIAELRVRTEVYLPSQIHVRSGKFRVDLVFYRDETPVLLCETKRPHSTASWEKSDKRQARAYKASGIPYMLVKSPEDIAAAIKAASLYIQGKE